MTDSTIQHLLQIMATLRDPVGGCPWDQEQTFETIAPYTIEEAYEVADAIDKKDLPNLRDELGDLLFQVVFHARLAEELNAFDFDDVVSSVCEKMVRRHPHVFADDEVADAHAQTEAWEAIKARERRDAATLDAQTLSELDGLPNGLPAMIRALKLQRRAARVGFDWEALPPVLDKVREELSELEAELQAQAPEGSARLDEELGDLLFAVVNVARHTGVEPDGALRRANLKFERRFRAMERESTDAGQALKGLSPEQLEKLWQSAKSQES